jgi:hypothetical protein
LFAVITQCPVRPVHLSSIYCLLPITCHQQLATDGALPLGMLPHWRRYLGAHDKWHWLVTSCLGAVSVQCANRLDWLRGTSDLAGASASLPTSGWCNIHTHFDLSQAGFENRRYLGSVLSGSCVHGCRWVGCPSCPVYPVCCYMSRLCLAPRVLLLHAIDISGYSSVDRGCLLGWPALTKYQHNAL